MINKSTTTESNDSTTSRIEKLGHINSSFTRIRGEAQMTIAAYNDMHFGANPGDLAVGLLPGVLIGGQCAMYFKVKGPMFFFALVPPAFVLSYRLVPYVREIRVKREVKPLQKKLTELHKELDELEKLYPDMEVCHKERKKFEALQSRLDLSSEVSHVVVSPQYWR